MNSNFGLLDPVPGAPRNKDQRREKTVQRAVADFAEWRRAHELEARALVSTPA
jgi:folate-dependent tRNA-U54 methylase TrmFO/GidA